MHHGFQPSNGHPCDGCWHFGGRVDQSTALCLQPGSNPIRSMAHNGCSSWERASGGPEPPKPKPPGQIAWEAYRAGTWRPEPLPVDRTQAG